MDLVELPVLITLFLSPDLPQVNASLIEKAELSLGAHFFPGAGASLPAEAAAPLEVTGEPQLQRSPFAFVKPPPRGWG